MSNTFWKALTEGVIKNLPAILTGTAVVTGIGTAAYSTWAGWKIKEVTEDEAIDNKTKVKKIVLLSLPILGGTAVSSGCAIAAQKENSKRIATLAAGTVGVMTLASDDTKEKILEVVDKKHRVHQAKKRDIKPDIAVGSNEVIEVKDLVTGYRFKTTLSDLWYQTNQFNKDIVSLGAGDHLSIGEFYERLLGDEYEHAPAYESIKFGMDILDYSGNYDKLVLLNIQLDSELTGGLKPTYTIEYDYLD